MSAGFGRHRRQESGHYHYTYDTWGNRNSSSDTLEGSTVAKTYLYDALDRLKTVSNGTAAQDEGTSFDLFGNRSAQTLGNPVSKSLSYQFDAAQQLTQIQQTIGAATSTSALLQLGGQVYKRSIHVNMP